MTNYRIPLLTVLLLLAAASTQAQTKVWTNADLGRPVAQWQPRRPEAQAMARLQDRAFVPAPAAAGTGPLFVVFGQPDQPPPGWDAPARPLSSNPYDYLPVPFYQPFYQQPWVPEPPRARHNRERRR
jgi:hypothetical protein